MARERLTTKTAEEIVKMAAENDVYTMNNPEHAKNEPKEDAYVIGDPSSFGEDVNKTPVGGDLDTKTRDKATNHPSDGKVVSAAEAVKNAKMLEEKAIKCVVASQRILPGAPDEIIEVQATELMQLPDNCINALLGRQEKLAKVISETADKMSVEAKEKSPAQIKAQENFKEMIEKKKAEKAKKKEAAIADLESKLAAIKNASDDDDDDEEEKKEEEKDVAVEEKKEEVKDAAVEEKKEEVKDAAVEEKKEEEKDAAVEEKKEEEKKEEEKDAAVEEKDTEKEASDNLLDDIFSVVTASDAKKGAKTLSGMVKKEASDNSPDTLSAMWGSAPDVSSYFDTRS